MLRKAQERDLRQFVWHFKRLAFDMPAIDVNQLDIGMAGDQQRMDYSISLKKMIKIQGIYTWAHCRGQEGQTYGIQIRADTRNSGEPIGNLDVAIVSSPTETGFLSISGMYHNIRPRPRGVYLKFKHKSFTCQAFDPEKDNFYVVLDKGENISQIGDTSKEIKNPYDIIDDPYTG